MRPRPAATLIVLRAGQHASLEVLMTLRPNRGFFGGLWVFPGGGIEPIDATPEATDAYLGPEDADDSVWRIAALRETVEEVSLAITSPPTNQAVVASGDDVFKSVVAMGRKLDGTGLRVLSQWVTPVGAPTRFDARFYLTVLEDRILLVPQPDEVIDMAWISPSEALANGESGEWNLVLPTRHHLEWLAGHDRPEDAWAAAARSVVTPVEPVIESDGSVVTVGLPSASGLP